MKDFEWGIIGGGIAGIAISEILSRQGHSVTLIEKNELLASETTREFHEWIHTGALYTLIPDKFRTLKYILGAIDDLVEYYSCFERMNISSTDKGLVIRHGDLIDKGWFSPNYIDFKYRIKGRKLTFPWLIGVARSIDLIEKIHNHDFLRRRAGELGPLKANLFKNIIKGFYELLKTDKKFVTVTTPDFTTNSRLLLRDILSTAVENGTYLSLNNEIRMISKKEDKIMINGKNESFNVKKIAICAGAGVLRFFPGLKIKTSYAPIAVVDNISPDARSFVELDYFPKNCINMLTKGDGVALIGGISLNNSSKCQEYIDYVIKEHKKHNPSMRVIDTYVGSKNEIVFNKDDRSYVFHINEVPGYDNVWSIIPGKFTLAFSLAPEFYRRVYGKNPIKSFNTHTDIGKQGNFVANSFWQDSINNKEY